MRIFHTLWTRPMKPERARVTKLLYALSYHYARQIGAQIVLHTDTAGRSLLRAIPYDEVYCDLDSIPDNIKRFWAYGKLYATNREPLGSVHIDGDVFLKSSSLCSLFDGSCDLVTQSVEGERWRMDYSYEITQAALSLENLPYGLELNYPLAYNCGVVQLNNGELKERYLRAYFDTVQRCIKDADFPRRIEFLNKKYKDYGYVIPDIVPEQQFLHQLAQGYRCREILEGDILTDARLKGYTHLCANIKWGMGEELSRLLYNVNRKLFDTL